MKRKVRRILIAIIAIVSLLCLSSIAVRDKPEPTPEPVDERLQIHLPVPETPLLDDPEAPAETETPIPETIKPTMIDMPEPKPMSFYYTDDEVLMLSRLLYSECRGVSSDTEKACVVWTVLNRVDSNAFTGDTITAVLLQKNQFAYNKNAPVWDDLRVIVEDVLWKWSLERNGHTDVGRVLPNNYFWFNGDGKHNYFRDTYETYKAHIWDYSLESPYES